MSKEPNLNPQLYYLCTLCGVKKYITNFGPRGHRCRKCVNIKQNSRKYDTICIKCNKYVKIFLDGQCKACYPMRPCKVCHELFPKSPNKKLTKCAECVKIMTNISKMSTKARKLRELEKVRKQVLES